LDFVLYGSPIFPWRGAVSDGRSGAGTQADASQAAAEPEGGRRVARSAGQSRRAAAATHCRCDLAPADAGLVAPRVALADGERVPGHRPRRVGAACDPDQPVLRDARPEADGRDSLTGGALRAVAGGSLAAPVGGTEGRRGRAPAAAAGSRDAGG